MATWLNGYMAKKWNVLGKIEDKKNRLEEIVEILLENRGIKTKKQIEEFFNPKKPSDLSLSELDISQTEVNKAIKRIKKAIKDKEKIIVYSDYDADGICGGAIIWETLYNLGALVLPYVPHREKEGYGLSEIGINTIMEDEFYAKDKKPSLIITVDHGISANKEVDFANKKGMDVIIIDHHEKSKKDPNALAIIHTIKLCGAGTAWIFCRKLDGKKEIQLDLATIATISDLVSLTNANRSFVKYGLEEINKTDRIGINAIIEESGIKKGNIGTYEIGFIIGPRLNAMGRIVHGLDALRLLCTKDVKKAKNLALTLGLTNKERQQLTLETTLHAKTLLKNQTAGDKKSKKIIFIYHETYNQGIIGLVAGRLTEEFYLPSIVISKGEKYSKASARSIAGLNIIETIRKTEDLLINCGGHPMAAGFTVETDKLELLQKKIEEIAEKNISEENLERTLKIDLEIELSDLNWEFFKKISLFSPFGIGNPEPVFVAKKLDILNLRFLGNEGKHLKLFVSDKNGNLIEAIAFGMGSLGRQLLDETAHVQKEKTIDIAFTLSENVWNGNKKLQLKVKDLKIN